MPNGYPIQAHLQAAQYKSEQERQRPRFGVGLATGLQSGMLEGVQQQRQSQIQELEQKRGLYNALVQETMKNREFVRVDPSDPTNIQKAQPLTMQESMQQIDNLINRRPLDRGVALRNKTGVVVDLKEQRLQRQQDRLEKQNYQTMFFKAGGKVSEKDLEELGIDLEGLKNSGRAIPEIENGKRLWNVMDDKTYSNFKSEQKWNKSEIEYFANMESENARWDDVERTLDDLGINENTMNRIGETEFDVINTPIGPFSMPAKFTLYGQYAKDPRYTALKRKIELAFQAFRKRVTGAQASDKELKMLRPIMPSLQDRIGVFFATIKEFKRANIAEAQRRLQTYKNAGRDTSRFEKYYNKQSQNNTLRNKAIQELRDVGYPITEKNINAAIQELGGQ